ncbi:MAG: ion transporter [Alphaproteobacteria bacterium]|nr:ion transporter [Alphaproteobacteria bacterium]
MDGPRVTGFIAGVILLNAVTLALETVPAVMAAWGGVLLLADRIMLAIFVAEIALKLIAHGPRFFRNGWNLFDFVIVAISVAPVFANLSILRALRVLRVLRLLSLLPRMRIVVEALGASLPGIGAIGTVLAVVFFVAAVLATKLFGAEEPELFGSIGASLFTLFQVMTLESWSTGVARPVMDGAPLAWLFFVPFIVVCTFMVLNLFIAVIVSSLSEIEKRDARAAEEAVHDEAALLRGQIAALADQVARLERALREGRGAP